MLDVHHDQYLKTLRQLQEKVDFPSYVLTYDIDKEPSMYAWPEKRACPIDSPAATYLSLAYQMLAENKDAAPESVKAEMLKAATIYGIEKDILDLVDALQPEQEKIAFLLEEDTPRGKVKLYPVKDNQDWEAAQESFSNNYLKFPPKWREKIASKLLAMKPTCINLAPVVESHAKCAICDPFILKEELEKRANEALMQKQNEAALAIHYLAESITPRIPSKRDLLNKIAEAITKYDEILGLPLRYNKEIRPPHESVWNTPKDQMFTKIATTVVIGPDVYQMTQITPHMLGIANILGEDFDKEAAQDILETLPRDLKYLVTNFLRDKGVTPCETL